ncbi:MAG: hypothetical protein OEW48_07900 [Phycisphaerae bacterium]|nr:hypothetical protein [Phycisphaerae bacterium]
MPDLRDFFNLRFYQVLPAKVSHANFVEKPTKTDLKMTQTDPKLTKNDKKLAQNRPKIDPEAKSPTRL